MNSAEIELETPESREIASPHPKFVRAPRALALPHVSLAAQVGPLLPGQVVVLEGDGELLNACAHAFLVEAVREPLGAEDGMDANDGDPRALVVDGGNCVSPYLFASTARARAQDPLLLTPRVQLARAFTAYQMVALLGDSLEAQLKDARCDLLAVLCVRALFEDEDLVAGEARQLARHACASLGAVAREHRVPCLVTSPSPSAQRLPVALQNIVRESASRVVENLVPTAVPGLGRSRRQRPLDGWGEMPARRTAAGPRLGTARGAAMIEAHWRPKTSNTKPHADGIEAAPGKARS